MGGMHPNRFADLPSRLLRYDIAGDAVVLRAGDEAALEQVVCVLVGAVGDDAVRDSGIDAGESFELLGGGLVDVDRALGFQAVDYSLGDGFGIADGCTGGLGCVLPDGVGAAVGGGAANQGEQTGRAEKDASHGDWMRRGAA